MTLSQLNVLPFIDWVAGSSLSHLISTSTWAFAVIVRASVRTVSAPAITHSQAPARSH